MRHLPTGTVTLLFTDIEGSTHLLQRLGSRYAQVLTECRTLLRAAFERWDGYEVDTQGDAFFVAFTSAADALAAAVNAQRALFTHSWPDDVVVRVRMGLHTGEPEATSEGYIGMDVHHAARVMSAGHGGQVLLSQVTRDLVVSELPSGVSLRDLGEYSLKDIEGVNHLFQLVIADLPNDFPPLRASGPRQIRYLPLAPTPFIGREQEVATARNLLRNVGTRLLTLVGPAGVGKTRLALQVATTLANAFLNGVAFIDLSQARDTESFVAAIAQLLAIKEEAGQALLERVIANLQALHILLVLDNFEQVTSARPILARLLATCDQLQVLVTSRAVLHMQAEQILEVPPLALPEVTRLPDLAVLSRYEAIILFVQRAQAVQPDFRLMLTNAPFVARICTQLDGIPLAIELAAARIRYFPPQALLAQLQSGINILSKKSPDIPLRQQTLRDAIAWSYELLSEEERRIFRRLAVCAHGCTIEAAQHICGLEGAPLELLEMLVDQSMLQLQRQDEQEPRFTMLQTLREFGLERLAEANETEAIQTAHALYYLSWAQQAATFSTGAQQVEWLDRQEQEYENLRTALEWMLHQNGEEWGERVLLFCIALTNFWDIRGPFSEGATFLQRALDASLNAAPEMRAEALQQAAYLALSTDNTTRAEALLHESQTLYRASKDKAGMADILRMQGSLAWAKSNYKLARRLLDEALSIYRELGNRKGVISTRAALAQIAIIQCDFSRARALLEENIAYHQAWDERYQTAHPLYHLARIFFLAQSPQQQALEVAEHSLALFRQVRNGRMVAYVLCLLAQIHLVQKNRELALPLLAEALSKFEEAGDRYGRALALTISACLSASRRDTTTARKSYEESWQLIVAIDARELKATCLEGTGEVLLAQGEATRAIQLWAQAATLRADIVAPMPPTYRGCYERAVADARKQLGAKDFQAAWTQGRQELLEQASI